MKGKLMAILKQQKAIIQQDDLSDPKAQDELIELAAKFTRIHEYGEDE